MPGLVMQELRVPPDSCLYLPMVGIAQKSPGLCLPAFPPATLPVGSKGQLFPGGAGRAHLLTSAPKSPLVSL